MGKYLLLGASSDLCRTFMKRHEWQESDVIIAQYCHSRDKLEALQKTISAKMELWQADFSDETSTTAFGEKLKEAKLCLPISTTFLLKIYASRKLTGQIPKSKSMSSAVPPKFLDGYVTAKYALMGMGKALASEYAPKGIQVNMISPSMMETRFLANVYGGVVEQTAAINPLKRNARPEDVAGLIEYLFSDKNTFVTGVNFPVTGGALF